MNNRFLLLLAVAGLLSTSCDDDDDNPPQTVAPTAYEFARNGVTSVDYNGQTTRIEMGEEFIDALKDETLTEAALDGMFAHAEGDADFSDPDLNASSKNIRSKTSASSDYYASNTTDGQAIKAQFDAWIAEQVAEVFPNWGTDAAAGIAGKIQENGGGSTRYVNGKGVELNQIINKGLIGGLMADQMLNNYLSTAVLDAATNVEDNNSGTLATDKNYTTMEHKWDEAFGYLYGTDNAANPQLGADSFLNKYLAKVESDPDFTGIADDIYDAFKLGRAAIVNKDYETRDAQAEIIREKISEVIGVRAVYYLQQGKNNLSTDTAAGFHDLSEGIGFIYSLQFTRQPNSTSPYFTKAEVEDFYDTLMEGNGFWDVSAATLEEMSEDIAAKFTFTVEEAGN
ncbi:DUF4856 domain-containing protein [Urechidicola sp. KH5]